MSNPVFNFFKDTFKDVSADKEIKTGAIVLAIEQMTGSKPIVDRTNKDINVIRFTKKQKELLKSYFDKKLVKKDKSGQSKPSNVKIDHKPLWLPIVIQKALPYAIGAVVIGVLIGRATK
jgi:hypothetical protein